MPVGGRIRFVFFFNDTATTEIYTLSLHDALPIYYVDVLTQQPPQQLVDVGQELVQVQGARLRSEEHTSELQSHSDLVCRLLLEKKKRRTDEEIRAWPCPT